MENVTNHGEKRLRKRLGATKQNAHKRAEEAYYQGTPPKGFSGRFRKYLDAISQQHRTTPVVYKGNIFIFGGNQSLITCWPVEAKYRKYLKNVKDE